MRGRTDHLAVDVARQRLFVAELGNGTVGVVELFHHSVLRTLTGLHEPQGVGYEPTTDTLYVANAADGAVQLFQGADLAPVGRIDLGDHYFFEANSMSSKVSGRRNCGGI